LASFSKFSTVPGAASGKRSAVMVPRSVTMVAILVIQQALKKREREKERKRKGEKERK
jgi:hypothetical protein